MKSKLPITICMIAKNEEKYLEECLRRVSKYGFEIIVTDTGSTDRTKEIAAKYADKVLDFEWINDFSAARNFCAEHASNNWILSLDCDEYVEHIDIPQLRICLQKFPKLMGGIHMKMLAYDVWGKLMYTTGDVFRLYNRRYYRFVNKIHEQLREIGNEENDTNIKAFLVPMDVVHQGYALQGEEMEKKQMRNIEMLRTALADTPNDSYLYFQLGQSLFVIRHYEEAIEVLEKAVDLIDNWGKSYTSLCVLALGKAYSQANRRQDALALLAKYEDTCKTAHYSYYQACVYHDVCQPTKALFYYLKTAAMKDFEALGENCADTYKAIIEEYDKLGHPEMSKPYVKKLEAFQKEHDAVMATHA